MPAKSKVRLQIAQEAARLMHGQLETQYRLAKLGAIEKLKLGEVGPKDLPTNTEVRIQIRKLARLNAEVQELRVASSMLRDMAATEQQDVFQIYETLLLPLEDVEQNLNHHPEGDALYHSLQVFDLARDQLPYDEEFLTAALLHDVGKAIDPDEHLAAGLEALDGIITERTAWLIEHHMLAHAITDQTIGHRAHRRLRESEYYEDLILLGECDRAGRRAGVEAPELEEALDYLRELSQMFG